MTVSQKSDHAIYHDGHLSIVTEDGDIKVTVWLPHPAKLRLGAAMISDVYRIEGDPRAEQMERLRQSMPKMY